MARRYSALAPMGQFVPGEAEFYAPYRERAAARRQQQTQALAKLRELEKRRRDAGREFDAVQGRLATQFGLTHGLAKRQMAMREKEMGLRYAPKPELPSEFERLIGRFDEPEAEELIRSRYGMRPQAPQRDPERMRILEDLMRRGITEQQAMAAVFPSTKPPTARRPGRLEEAFGLAREDEQGVGGKPLSWFAEQQAWKEATGKSKWQWERDEKAAATKATEATEKSEREVGKQESKERAGLAKHYELVAAQAITLMKEYLKVEDAENATKQLAIANKYLGWAGEMRSPDLLKTPPKKPLPATMPEMPSAPEGRTLDEGLGIEDFIGG